MIYLKSKAFHFRLINLWLQSRYSLLFPLLSLTRLDSFFIIIYFFHFLSLLFSLSLSLWPFNFPSNSSSLKSKYLFITQSKVTIKSVDLVDNTRKLDKVDVRKKKADMEKERERERKRKNSSKQSMYYYYMFIYF